VQSAAGAPAAAAAPHSAVITVSQSSAAGKSATPAPAVAAAPKISPRPQLQKQSKQLGFILCICSVCCAACPFSNIAEHAQNFTLSAKAVHSFNIFFFRVICMCKIELTDESTIV